MSPKHYLKIAITRDRLVRYLVDTLEYDQNDVNEMSDEEKLDCFLGSGCFENESEFAGVFDTIPDEFIDIDVVSSETGWPVSLDDFYRVS